MKFDGTLAKTVFTIALIPCMFSTAAARGMSLEVAQPLQIEVLERAPNTDFGFHPFDSDVARKSLFWNAFPEPPQAEFFEKNPTDAVKQPQQCDTICEKNPTQAVREPLDMECCGPTMSFNLKEAARTEVAIYNVNGRLVRRLSEMLSSGESSLTWDGMDDRGSRAASGVYFARVQANDETGKGKLVLVR